MASEHWNSLDEYEQLKRKNRRRLVGASAMVVVAGLIFGKAVAQPQIGYATVLSITGALIIGIVTAIYLFFARKLDEVV